VIDEYYTALKTQIELGQGLAGRVYDTVRLDANGALIRDNYVVLYSPVPLDVPQDRFTMTPTFVGTVEFESDVRVVGTTAATVRQMMSRVSTQMIGHGLTITGRQPARVTLGSSGRVLPDTSVKPFLYYADMSFEWTSRAA
jgi:hypothetical protein